MAQRYIIDRQLIPREQAAGISEYTPQVNVMTEAEFTEFPFVAPEHRDTIRTLLETENTYLDVFSTCFIGSVAMPSREDASNEPYCFAFYLDRGHLLLLDNGSLCAKALERIREGKLLHEATTAYCLYEFMRLLTKGDQKYLSDYEDTMESTEEAILANADTDTNQVMLGYRRTLLKLDTYYRQLVDMTDDIADNENGILTDHEAHLFQEEQLACERLMDRVSTLREYSIQLRELHQTQIDTQQNNTMQIFTIITVLFVPLTLMTGWFGMNFVHFPGLDAVWAYPVFVLAVVLIVVVEIIIFRRKGWM